MYAIIETGTNRGLVALCQNGLALGAEEFTLGIGFSPTIEKALDRLLTKANSSVSMLEFIGVGSGPGSYTGLRVGVAAAKGIAIGLSIPLVALSTLKSYVPPKEYEGHFFSVIDAKIGGVYCIEGKKEGDTIAFLGSEALVSFEDFYARLLHFPSLVTPLWKPLRARIGERVHPCVYEVGPSAYQLALQAQHKFLQKEYSLDGTCELLYLRLAQAEMEKLPNKASLG